MSGKPKAFAEIGGLRKHPAYGMLDKIKQRCYNKKCKAYPDYGAIGIGVCDEWKNSYVSFCRWADENGYKKGLTIDRLDTNKGYSPENCRLISRLDQRENRHIQRNNKTGYTGVSYSKSNNKYHSYYWIDGKRINCGYYKTAKEANMAREEILKEKNIKYRRDSRL
jgi:hypothetical protein